MATIGEKTRGNLTLSAWARNVKRTRTYYAHVPVYGGYPLVRTRLEQLACDELLNSQDNTIFALDSDSCATVLYCLDRIFDLSGSVVSQYCYKRYVPGNCDHPGRRLSFVGRSLCLSTSVVPVSGGLMIVVRGQTIVYSCEEEECVWR